MIRATRLLLVTLLLLSTAGCGGVLKEAFRELFGPPRPPVESYRLHIPAPARPSPADRRNVLPGRLAIAPYVTRGVYASRGIAFRVDDVRLDAYPSREWAIPLRDMLGQATETLLEGNPLTSARATFDPRAASSFDYQWRGTVVEFEEVNINRDQRVLAAVHLEADLVRMANDSVIWSGSERLERAVPEPTDSMPRVVETLSALTAEVITRLIERAHAEVSTPAAPAVPTAAAAPPPR